MLLFVTAVSVVLVISFLCSIFESVLLSLTRPQIEIMVRSDKRAGRMLARFKENMDVPIAAIGTSMFSLNRVSRCPARFLLRTIISICGLVSDNSTDSKIEQRNETTSTTLTAVTNSSIRRHRKILVGDWSG